MNPWIPAVKPTRLAIFTPQPIQYHAGAWQAIWACWKSKVKVMVWGDSHLHTARGMAKRAFKSFTDAKWHSVITRWFGTEDE
jgi:hypothetical protein